ncbi:hypothetical protein HPB49_001110 [Dermacentor silvarum]|uniref:Uncharacterized protein n=1 Tax=Dermacentor silvarum TaxID=543639 RepID=A0ACB8D204_DERSI|nr:hypothetical protein HPB49_001110 [Dermacentor silvarum]
MNVLTRTMRRAVRRDLKVLHYKFQGIHGLTEEQRKSHFGKQSWALQPDGAYSTPVEEKINTTRRLSDKLKRRSGARTSSMANTETSAASAATLDASVVDVSRRQQRTALLDSLPVRDVSVKRQRAQKHRRGTDAESVSTKADGEASVIVSSASPAPSPANKDGSKVASDSIVDRVDDSRSATVHSGSKGAEKGGVSTSTTQSTKTRKRRDKTKETAAAAPNSLTATGSSEKDPQPGAAVSREDTTSKRRTSTGSHRRKKRAQEGVAVAVTNSDGAPLSAFPVGVVGAASATAATPPAAGEEPSNESPHGAVPGVDVPRASIMKLPCPSSRAAASASANKPRRRSTVDFGLVSSKDLNEGDLGKASLSPDGLALSGEKLTSSKGTCQFAADVAGGTCSENAGSFSKQLTPTAPNARRRLLLAPRRFSALAHVTSPGGPFASASVNGKMYRCTVYHRARVKCGAACQNCGEACDREHNSLRTACLLTCSLVTMSASASSMITSAAKDALASNFIVKKSLRGLVAWLVLVTPASILCAVSCCSALYFFHLSGRKRQTAEEINEVCATAATRLSNMGPIKNNDLVIAYGLVGYIGFMTFSAVFGYNERTPAKIR